LLFVNVRVLNSPLSGVQRYLASILKHTGEELCKIDSPVLSSGAKGHAWEQLVLPNLVRGGLLWSPANTGPLIVRRQVVTIHDAAVLDHPEWFNPRFSSWYGFLLPRLARRVEGIITVSEFSRQRLLERTGVSGDKVSVIHIGVDDEMFHPVSSEKVSRTIERFGICNSYFLAVGSIEPRKNLQRVFEAWERVYLRLRPTKLVVVGGSGKVFSGLGYKRIPDGVVFLGRVDDEFLPSLYTGAIALIYPSLYEGFGLPPLEAMACATPVIVSDTTSLPEVVGKAALTVNPFSVEEIADAIMRIYDDADLQRRLSRLGLARAKEFNWGSVARRTMDVLHQYANK
jgi:glycosyltransferase involved in cell wall biosynthesis